MTDTLATDDNKLAIVTSGGTLQTRKDRWNVREVLELTRRECRKYGPADSESGQPSQNADACVTPKLPAEKVDKRIQVQRISPGELVSLPTRTPPKLRPKRHFLQLHTRTFIRGLVIQNLMLSTSGVDTLRIAVNEHHPTVRSVHTSRDVR